MVIPPQFRQRLGLDIGDQVSFSFAHGSFVMKPPKQGKFKKIRKEDLREEPEWLKAVTERAQNSRWGKMSDEEIGQLTEELAERGAKKRQAQQSTT